MNSRHLVFDRHEPLVPYFEAEECLPSRGQINRLQAEMAKMPQAELPTEHFFANGMYCRKMSAAAGTLIVGKVHLQEHFFMVLSGELEVRSEQGNAHIKAGDVFVSQPGMKRVGLALTDVVVVNVHRTDSTDLDEIEREVIEPDELALFDAHNHLKAESLLENDK